MPDDCVFCSIIRGSTPADIVLDRGPVVAFLDVRPLFPGHVLVCPRAHVETIEDLPDDLVAPLFTAVRSVTSAVRRAVGAEGAFVAQNNVVSQSVPHLHVHVVPRRRGDGLRGFFWPRTGYDDEDHRMSVAESIRDELDQDQAPMP